jgi:hypothetical protein
LQGNNNATNYNCKKPKQRRKTWLNALDDNGKDFSKYHPSIPNFFSLSNSLPIFSSSLLFAYLKKMKINFTPHLSCWTLEIEDLFFAYAKNIVYCVYLYILPQDVRVHNRMKYCTSKKHRRLWFRIKNVLHHNLCLHKEKKYTHHCVHVFKIYMYTCYASVDANPKLCFVKSTSVKTWVWFYMTCYMIVYICTHNIGVNQPKVQNKRKHGNN